MAALEEGLITPELDDRRHGRVQARQPGVRQTPRTPSSARCSCARALTVSSDVFFYELGAQANGKGPIIQEWARRLGIGRQTGIDIPGEFAGLVPDAQVAQQGLRRVPQVREEGQGHARHRRGAVRVRRHRAALVAGRQRQPRRRPGRPAGDAAAARRPPTAPSPTAAAWCARTSARRSRTATGGSCSRSASRARRKVEFSAANQQAIMDGLRGAATETGGTSADVFRGFPLSGLRQDRHGGARARTPTSPGTRPTSPHPTRPIVVVTTIERGGFGAETAAPAARLILAEWFHLSDRSFHAGSSQTR